MKTLVRALVRALRVAVLSMLAAFLAAPAFARTLSIGADLSDSNPLIKSESFAKAAAARVYNEIASLQLGDYVVVRRFGERGADKMPAETLRITRQQRAKAVASKVAGYVANLPKTAANGERETQLIAFLEFGSRFDCANSGKILLLSDSVEHSPYITGAELLRGKPLPAPDADLLKGCEVVMFGLGQSKDGSLPPQAIKTLRAAWAAWMKTAGADFTAIIDP